MAEVPHAQGHYGPQCHLHSLDSLISTFKTQYSLLKKTAQLCQDAKKQQAKAYSNRGDLTGGLNSTAISSSMTTTATTTTTTTTATTTTATTTTATHTSPTAAIPPQLLHLGWLADFAYTHSSLAETGRSYYSLQITTSLLNPLATYLRQLEIKRRSFSERYSDYTRALTDAHAAVRRAKRDFVNAKANADDVGHSVQFKAMVTIGKDKDKMAAKLHAAQEKARQAKEFLRHFEDCAKAAESEYNLQLLPSLCEDIRMIEEEATLYLKSWFENMLGLEKSYLEKRLNALSGLSERISACNVEAAFSESIHQNYRPARSDFSKMSMISPTPNPSSSNDVTTIMEKALPNPSQEPSYTMTGLLKSCIHSGYLLMKRGDVTAGWKRRFFVLVGSHSTPQSSTTSTSSKRLLLYCFENETATHAREIIPVYGTCVYALHESFFETSNCFQLHVKACSSSSSISSSTFEDYNNTVNQDSSSTVMTTVYNFSAESQIQSYQWMECLKTGVRMVIADNDNNFTTIDERGNTITTSSLHSGDNKKVDYLEKFRRIRNIQVSISEAKNISRVFGGNSSNANAGVSGSGSSSSSSIFKNAIRSKQAAAAANAAAIMTQQQQQLLDTYMIVCLDNVKMAKTRPKQGDAPFWSESFTFEDTAPTHTKLRAILFNRSSLHQDACLGSVSISLDRLQPGQTLEEWIPLNLANSVPSVGESGGGGADAGVGVSMSAAAAVRISITLNEDALLPVICYEPFLAAGLDNDMTFIKMINSQTASTAKIILNALILQGRDVDALKVLMAHEISRSDSNNPALLFRANSLASKLLDHYMKIKAITPYLHNTLGKLLGRICAISESCEVDPGRVESGASAAQNAKVLQGLVTNIWNSILQSVDKLPVELVELFSHIRMKCMEKYSGDEASQYSAVSGFIFLRFFCPAIITPKLFGMATELPSPVTARNLTLIAKILQNLANLVEFGGAKEPYMVEFNPFIRSNIEAMKFFLQKISQPRIEPYSGSGSGGYSVASSSSFSTATTTPSSSNTTTSVDRRRAYEQLYRLFRSNLPVTSLSAARGGVELMGAMNRLQNMHQRISSPSSSGDGNLLSIMGDKYSMATSAHKSSTIHTNNDGDNTIPVTSSASTSSVASATSASLLQPLPRNDSMSSLKSSSILSIQSVSSFSSSSADDAAAPEVPSKSISDLLPPTLPPRTTPINKLGIDFKFGNFWKDYQSKKAAAAAASIGGARNSGGGSASEKRRGAVANSIHVGDMQDYYLSALSSLETAPTSDQLLVGISEEEEEEVDQDRGISSLLSSQATSESTIVSPTSPSSSSARFFGKFTTSISSKHSDGEDSTSLVDVSATSPTSSKTSKRMSLGAMIKSVRL